MPHRYHVTVEKRLLLYLKEYLRYNDKFEVPVDITQEGIAEALGIRQHHVSRAITTLVDNGMVYERTAHIKGKKRRRKAYFLTQESIPYLEELEQEIGSQTVTVKTGSGELRDMTVTKICSELKAIYSVEPTLFELTNTIITDGEADLTKNYSFLNRSASAVVVRRGEVPVVTAFIGREEEIKLIHRFSKSTEKTVLAIYGLAGIGKTTLAARVCHDEKERSMFWYPCNEWTTTWHILEELRHFTADMKGENEVVEADQTRDVNSWVGKVAGDLNKQDALIVLDDVHKLNNEAQSVLRLLLAALKGGSSNTILLGRYKPKLYSRQDTLEGAHVMEMELKGIDIKTAKRFVHSKGMDDKTFKRLYTVTKGHPLALKLLGRDGKHNVASSFTDFLEEEVLSDLSADQIELLKLVSVFRQPIQPDPELLGDLDYEQMKKLQSRYILLGFPDGSVSLHDALRSLFNKRIASRSSVSYHKKAVTYYTNFLDTKQEDEISEEDQHQASARVEMSYHQLRAGDNEGAYKTLRTHMDAIKEEKRFDAVFILKDLARQQMKPVVLVNVHVMAGDLLFLQNDLKAAKKEYQHALRNIDRANAKVEDKTKHKLDPIPIYSKLGRVTDAEREYSQTVKHTQATLKIYEDRGDKRGMAKALNNLGLAYRNMGALDRSLRFYKKSIAVLRDLSELKGQAMTMTNVSDVYHLKGDNRRAIQYIDRALDICTQMKEPKLEAEILQATASLQMEEGDVEDARKNLEKALKLRKQVDDSVGFISTSLDMAKTYDDPSEGIKYLEKAIDYVPGEVKPSKLYSLRFRNLLRQYRLTSKDISQKVLESGMSNRDLRVLGSAYNSIAQLYSKNDNKTSAIKATKAALKLDIVVQDRSLYARDLIRTGNLLHASGEQEDALVAYETARFHLESLGEKEGLSTALSNIANVYLDQDRTAAALKYLDLAMKAAKESGYQGGIDRARELIREVGSKKAATKEQAAKN